MNKIKISGFSHDGRGIGTINNKKVFVSGALPDETVDFKRIKTYKHYDEAIATHIENPSEDRVDPICPHFGICGGCDLQHLSDQTQIEIKQMALMEQLAHFGKIIPKKWIPPLFAYSSHYRRKARLGVKYVFKKNKLLIGFREKQSQYLADLEICPILHPQIGKNFSVLRNFLMSLSNYQHIPQIEVAVGDETIALVIRHMKAFTHDDLEKIKIFGQQNQFHLYLQPSGIDSIHKIYPDDKIERLSYTLPEYQLAFLFHPLDFTQINLEMNRKMVKQALNLLAPCANDTILDLFCGIGNFTLPLAKFAESVIGIEGNASMVEKAFTNAAHNQMANVSFASADLFNPDGSASWMQKKYNKILIDPPRSGAKEIIKHIDAFKANKILYISCNPATFARDAGDLVEHHHYELTQLGLINMFPHTTHTEVMGLFEKY